MISIGDEHNKFLQLLNQNRVTKDSSNQDFTHTSLGNPMGKFYLGKKESKQLMKHYSKLVGTRYNLYLTEKHREQGPILIDIDTKTFENKRLDKELYMKVINLYKKKIELYLSTENPQFDLECYILTKEEITEVRNTDETIYKDGIHAIFPNLCTKPSLQYLIRENVIEELLKDESWPHTSFINDIHDIIDKSVIERNNWLMYGSCKPNYEKNIYKLYKLISWDENGKLSELKLTDEDKYGLPETLSIRNCSIEDLTDLVNGLTYEDIENNLEKYKKTKKNNNNHIISTNEDFIMAQKLTEILNRNRAENYESWLNLGFCLHNIDNNLLQTWIDFSKKSKKFEEGVCENLWKGFKNQGYKMGSLVMWAREDNELKYCDVIMELKFRVMDEFLTNKVVGCVKFFFTLYKDVFRIGSNRDKEWFYFENHKWNKIEDGYKVKMFIHEKFTYLYGKYAETLKKMMDKEDNSDLKNIYDKKISMCYDVKNKLLDTYPSKMMSVLECYYKDYDPDFSQKLDENKNLLCFKNGVLDLKHKVFRDGRPEDYISLCTNHDYISYQNCDKQKIKCVEDFLLSIQPEEESLRCLKDLLSSCLSGYVLDQTFNILTGSGGNGKSLLFSLLQSSLGDYAKSAPPELLTRRSEDADKASPTIAKCKGIRLVYLEEPDSKDTLMLGKLKAYTGNTKLQARKLHQDVFEFYPQFKIFLLCNKLPIVDSNDGGTWRRILAILFSKKFVDNPTESYELKANKDLGDVLNFCCSEFIAILVEHYFNFYVKEGLKIPKSITEYTNSYRSNSDIFLDFINSQFIFTGYENDKVNLNSIVSNFKQWHRATRMESKSNIRRNDLKSEFNERFTRCDIRENWKYLYLREDLSESQINDYDPDPEITTSDKYKKFRRNDENLLLKIKEKIDKRKEEENNSDYVVY